MNKTTEKKLPKKTEEIVANYREFMRSAPIGTVWRDLLNGNLWMSTKLLLHLNMTESDNLDNDIVSFDGELYFAPNDNRSFYAKCRYQPMKHLIVLAEW